MTSWARQALKSLDTLPPPHTPHRGDLRNVKKPRVWCSSFRGRGIGENWCYNEGKGQGGEVADCVLQLVSNWEMVLWVQLRASDTGSISLHLHLHHCVSYAQELLAQSPERILSWNQRCERRGQVGRWWCHFYLCLLSIIKKTCFSLFRILH